MHPIITEYMQLVIEWKSPIIWTVGIFLVIWVSEWEWL